MTAAFLKTQSRNNKIGDRSQDFLLSRPYALDIAYAIWREGLIPLAPNEGQRPEERLRQTVENHLTQVFKRQWHVWRKHELRDSIGIIVHSGLITETPAGTTKENAEGETVRKPTQALGLIQAVSDLLEESIEGVCPKCQRSVFLHANYRAADCRYQIRCPEHGNDKK